MATRQFTAGRVDAMCVTGKIFSRTEAPADLLPAAGVRCTVYDSAMMLPMPEVKIGTEHRHLLLTALNSTNASPRPLAVDLHLDGLTASVLVAQGLEVGFQDLADFFEQQARDWRGWEGSRDWESLEGELRIEARHAHGHVQLRVTVRKTQAGWGNNGWVATGDLTIDPGDQLAGVAAALKTLTTG